jgi:hypothetical protein
LSTIEVSREELLLLTFAGTLMATTGCSKVQAEARIAFLMTLTEKQLGLRAERAQA